jgi:hypothetical protein
MKRPIINPIMNNILRPTLVGVWAGGPTRIPYVLIINIGGVPHALTLTIGGVQTALTIRP